jgi:hypothetical protein
MAQSLDNLSRTWSDAGTTFTAIKYDITDSGSAAGSLLLDLRTNSTSRFSVTKAGGLVVSDGSASAPALRGADADSGIFFSGNNIRFTSDGGNRFSLDALCNLNLSSTSALRWTSSATDPNLVADLIILRDAANTLAQRNGANGQTFRLYGSFTDATIAFERFFIEAPSAAGATVLLGTQKGTGASARALAFQTDGTTRLTIAANGDLTSPKIATFDDGTNAGSIGPSGSFGEQPAGLAIAGRKGNLALVTNANGTAGRQITLAYYNGSAWYSSLDVANVASGFGALSLMRSGGNVQIGNGASTVGLLQFGGTTSSFPALKRSSTALEVKLADDSAYAPLAASQYSSTGANAQTTNVKQLTELTTIDAAATTDTTIEIPAGAILLGVTARVTVAITGTTTFDLGTAATADKFGDNVSSTATTTRVGSVAPELVAAATKIRITPDTTPSDNAGRVRITIHYIDLTAATS